jgi:hypothetical protein
MVVQLKLLGCLQVVVYFLTFGVLLGDVQSILESSTKLFDSFHVVLLAEFGEYMEHQSFS